jgi:hypothetical protein
MDHQHRRYVLVSAGQQGNFRSAAGGSIPQTTIFQQSASVTLSDLVLRGMGIEPKRSGPTLAGG